LKPGTVIYDEPITPDNLPMVEIGNFSFTNITCGTTPAEYVAVDTRGNVYSANAQRKGDERSIHEIVNTAAPSPSGGRIVFRKVVRAAGQVYALGTYRKLYRRVGLEQWVDLSSEGKGVPLPKDIDTNDMYDIRLGFRDLSAFGPNDMYAAGGDGDVWRFDGKKWKVCDFPTNRDLQTVCCAGDGKVYISEMSGTVWAGREDLWQKVAEADIAPGYHPVDSVWFNERLYLGGQEGLWAIDAKAKVLVPLADVEPGAPNAMVGGRLDLSPDGKHLLTAGPHGACLNDGSGWTRLFSSFDFL
jgi:hypothetical protein